jgi:hypothetical protein
MIAMFDSIPQTANDVWAMTAVSNGRNAADERCSARQLDFFRRFRLTDEVGIGILVIEWGKERGSF